MTEKAETLFKEYSQVKDPVERAKISYALYGKIAADQENKVPDIEKIKNSMGENWMAAGERFETILKEDKNKAFEMAIELTMLPISPDKEVEDVNKWIRGDGPGMLGREELRNNLLDYLGDPQKSDDLEGKLLEYVYYNFSKVKNSDDAFNDPKCYLSLSSIILGLKLEGNANSNENVRNLSEHARFKFDDPDVKRVVEFYNDLPDTKWLADEFNSFKVK